VKQLPDAQVPCAAAALDGAAAAQNCPEVSAQVFVFSHLPEEAEHACPVLHALAAPHCQQPPTWTQVCTFMPEHCVVPLVHTEVQPLVHCPFWQVPLMLPRVQDPVLLDHPLRDLLTSHIWQELAELIVPLETGRPRMMQLFATMGAQALPLRAYPEGQREQEPCSQ
jgi:hypothetical protein